MSFFHKRCQTSLALGWWCLMPTKQLTQSEGEVPLQINSICSPGIDIFSFTKFLISATVSCRTSWRWCLDGRLWNAERLGMWRRWYILWSLQGQRTRLVSQPDKHEAATSSHLSSIYFTCYKYTPFHEVLGPSTNGKANSQCYLQPPCPHPSDLRL